MITTRTPVRLSFFGGSTDFQSWSSSNGGAVVGGTIDQYSYISARYLPPYHDFKTRLMYSSIETVKKNGDIEHRAVKSIIEILGMESDGLEIAHMSDLPGRSGTGSSSTFVVGLLNALAGLQGKTLSPSQLARAAIMVEQEKLGEVVGCQDQTWAAFGGMNHIVFQRNGNINVYPLPLKQEAICDLESHLALYFTGLVRTSSDVAAGYASELATGAKRQWSMLKMVDDGIALLLKNDWAAFGRLLDRAWELKRSLPGVTNATIDRYYAAGRMAGAVGGKLLGAGGGGCLLFVLPSPFRRAKLTETMESEGLVHIPFRFEFGGSRIIFVDRKES